MPTPPSNFLIFGKWPTVVNKLSASVGSGWWLQSIPSHWFIQSTSVVQSDCLGAAIRVLVGVGWCCVLCVCCCVLVVARLGAVKGCCVSLLSWYKVQKCCGQVGTQCFFTAGNKIRICFRGVVCGCHALLRLRSVHIQNAMLLQFEIALSNRLGLINVL